MWCISYDELIDYLKKLNENDPRMYDFFLTEASSRGLYSSSSQPNLYLDFSRNNYRSNFVGNAKYLI